MATKVATAAAGAAPSSHSAIANQPAASTCTPRRSHGDSGRWSSTSPASATMASPPANVANRPWLAGPPPPEAATPPATSSTTTTIAMPPPRGVATE